MKSETRRLNKLKDTPKNEAKRYKLPTEAVKIIERAGKRYGQQSRAIQVAVELLWHKEGHGVSDSAMSGILSSPSAGKTYKLTPMTVSHIKALSHEYGTLGSVLAAVAYMLAQPDPRAGLSKMPGPLPHVELEPGRERETALERQEREVPNAGKRNATARKPIIARARSVGLARESAVRR
jgi:hypothetical protein